MRKLAALQSGNKLRVNKPSNLGALLLSYPVGDCQQCTRS
jgi:hypothetical protein